MTSNAMVEVRAARKAQLVQKLAMRERALFDAELELRAARTRADKERADLKDLEDVGASELLLSLTGQYEARYAKEHAEAEAAARAWRIESDKCALLREEVQRTRDAIARLGAPEQQLAPVEDDGGESRARELMLTTAALDELYEAQDALRVMRAALARAERWANLTHDREDGPARAHAEAIAATSYERFGQFENELTQAIVALENLGDRAPTLHVPPPESLRHDLANAWRRHKSLAVLEPRWDEIARAMDGAVEVLERWLQAELDRPAGPNWNVGSLFTRA